MNVVLFYPSKLLIPTKRSPPGLAAGPQALWQWVEPAAIPTSAFAAFNPLALTSSPFSASQGPESSPFLSLTVYFSFPHRGKLQHLNFKNKGIDFYLEFVFASF